MEDIAVKAIFTSMLGINKKALEQLVTYKNVSNVLRDCILCTHYLGMKLMLYIKLSLQDLNN